MASPYYLGDARSGAGSAGAGAGTGAARSGGTAAPSAASHARPYSYDDDDEDDEYGDGSGSGAGARTGSAAAQLQSYQAGSSSRPSVGSSFGSHQAPPSRYFGPQPGLAAPGAYSAGGGARSLGPSNPVLFDSSSSTQSPLLGGSSSGDIGESVLPQTSLGGGGGGVGSRGFRRTMDDAHASYSTSYSWSLSTACAVAYAFPPLTSVAVLILETTNDLARFHAYQAGLLGVGAWLLLWVLRSILGWYSLSVIVGMGTLGWLWVCASNAANAAPTLARVPYLPHIGPLAEQWVGEE